jgi:hypothetical protein
MTVHISAWYGVALILQSCFWLGVWARPRLAGLRRLAGGWLGRVPASGSGKAGTVERVRTYTGCSTAGLPQAGLVTRATPLAESRTFGPTAFIAASAGSRGADKQRPDAI